MIFGERLARNSRQAWSRVLTSRPRRAAPIKVRIAPWRSAAAAPMMSSVQTLRQWLGRLGKDSIYLMTGLPMGILTFTVAVTGWSLGLGMLITLIGFPVLVLTALALRGLAHVERFRLELVAGERPCARYQEPERPGFIGRV